MKKNENKFAFVTEGGHFWLHFKNGYILSCFNGYGSHTENQDSLDKWSKIYMSKNSNPYDNHWKSNLIEIAIIYNGDLVTRNLIDCDDDVKTVDIDEFACIVDFIHHIKG